MAYARPRQDGTSLVTVSVVNRTGHAEPVDTGCLFQVRFTVRVEGGEAGGILPYEDRDVRGPTVDEEEASLELLYRNARTFAVGHGCAADWVGSEEGMADQVSAECLPEYETPSITPDVADENGEALHVPIARLAGLVDGDDGLGSIAALTDAYARWISSERDRAGSLSPVFQVAANRHLTQAEAVLGRIRAGVEFLETDLRARRAFTLANRAMLFQQLRTIRRTPRETRYNTDERRIEVIEPIDIPDWREVKDRGNWRAFQIAFVLMCLGSTASSDSSEREVVELIFFPTGGGKTEAYLCLAGFLNVLPAPP